MSAFLLKPKNWLNEVILTKGGKLDWYEDRWTSFIHFLFGFRVFFFPPLPPCPCFPFRTFAVVVWSPFPPGFPPLCCFPSLPRPLLLLSGRFRFFFSMLSSFAFSLSKSASKSCLIFSRSFGGKHFKTSSQNELLLSETCHRIVVNSLKMQQVRADLLLHRGYWLIKYLNCREHLLDWGRRRIEMVRGIERLVACYSGVIRYRTVDSVGSVRVLWCRSRPWDITTIL